MANPLDRLNAAFAGRYSVERKVGAGGMATVYLARDVKHGRKVAVKVLRPELAATLGVDRFLREIEIAAQLSHPHIVPLLDSGKAGDVVYYVMPYVEGETLRAKIEREGQLAIPDVITYVRDIADALEHAHAKGVVHRDIKPDNVLITGRHALVMDFGVATALNSAADGPQLTTVGVAVGTPGYIAPEQAVAEGKVDHRADIYALGALTYELIAGRPPFIGESTQQILAAHIVESPRIVTDHRSGVPSPLVDLVMRCLEKHPQDRWQTTPELLTHLDSIVTPAAGVSHPTVRSRRRPARPRWLAAVAAAIVVAGGAIVGIRARWTGAQADQLNADRIVVLPFQNQTGDSGMTDVGQMAAEWITQGLHLQDLGDAVPAATIAQLLSVAGDGGDGMRTVTEFVDAGLVVSGSLFRDRDTLVFNAEVIDMNSGGLIGAIEPVRAAGVLEGIDAARERILGLVAAHFGFGKPATQQTPPPSVEIYRLVFAARDAFSRGALTEALEGFRRVSELDTAFVSHLPIAAGVHFYLGEYAQAESLATASLASGRLTSFERAMAQTILATVTGDVEAEYRAAKVQGSLDPTAFYNLAAGALRNNRPSEALAVLGEIDLDSPFASQWQGVWALTALSHHALGDHRAALDVAREATRRYPQSLDLANFEVRELAALGMVNELAERLDDLPPRAFFIPTPMDTPGWTTILGALEFRAHGYTDAANATIDRAIAWYRDRPAVAAGGESATFGLAISLYVAGRWSEARDLFEELARDDPSNVDYLGYLGVLAARAGDRARAMTIDGDLAARDDRFLFGQHTRWRARIAAQLGDETRALALLREAFDSGISVAMGQHWDWLHVDPDLEDLQSVDAFREWSAPKHDALTSER